MRVYVDSSALLKRVFAETETPHLQRVLGAHHDQRDALLGSSLAWMEVTRAVRRVLPAQRVPRIASAALSGVSERPITADVVATARRMDPPLLRTLDAIHLATAFLLDVDLVLTYDARLATACSEHNIAVAAPSAP